MSTSTLTKLLVAAALTFSVASHARAQEEQLDDSPAAEAPHKTVSTNDLVDQMEKVANDDDVVARKPEPKKTASRNPRKTRSSISILRMAQLRRPSSKNLLRLPQVHRQHLTWMLLS